MRAKEKLSNFTFSAWIFFSIWFGAVAFGCHPEKKPLVLTELQLVGAPGVSIELFRVTKPSKSQGTPRLLPVGQMQTGRRYEMPVGEYFAVTSCSSMYLNLLESESKKLFLRRIHLNTPRSQVTQQTEGQAPSRMRGSIPAECVNPYSGKRETWKNRTDFEILPGQVTLRIGGRILIEEVLMNIPEPLSFDLQYVNVRNNLKEMSASYFARALVPGSLVPVPVVSAQVGEILWLLPGNYMLELNGSTKEIELSKAKPFAQTVGALKVSSPRKFPMEERIRVSGKPIFAYINEGVIFTLDTPYLLFPGDYNVSLGGSDVREDYVVEAGKLRDVKTRGALLKRPTCPEGETCRRAPRITLHQDNRPFSLMTVETGVPFLVLEGKYQYGVAGIRGVLSNLKASSTEVHTQTLSRVVFEWQVRRGAPRVRTDLVRLETLSKQLYGRSLDLLFSKPSEIYVPPGSYELTYFVGEPSQERVKTKRVVRMRADQSVALVVPLYSDKVSNGDSEPGASKNESKRSGASSSSDLSGLPTTLQPIQ